MDRLTYKHDDKWCINGMNGKLISDKYGNYWGEAIDRLAAYENLEEQERIIVLPCKFGTTVYFIAWDKCYGGKCPWLKDGKCSKEQSPEYCPKEVLETPYSIHMYIDGTRVFLTREQAEAALNDQK